MRQPQKTQQRDSSRGAPFAYILIGLVVLAFAAFLVAGVWQQRHQVAIDAQTLCPKAGPKALTVILVDATDAMTPVQKASVQARLDATIAKLQQYEAVDVDSIEPGADLLHPEFRVCRPPSADETSDWTGNKTLARQQFDDVFKPRLREVLEKAADRPGSDASPIMEAIQQVAVGAFHKADVAAGKPLPKRLVIVSDMLENGAGGSHYKSVPDFATFAQSEAYRRLSAELEGVDVDILYLSRSDAAGVQGEPHAHFWRQYFSQQHARVRDVFWVEG